MRTNGPRQRGSELPDDAESAARAICLQQLSQRARSRAELAAVLHRRGLPETAAQSVLDRFTEVGLVDDSALAANFASAQHGERGLAARAVAAQLRQRGIDEPTVQAAIAPIDADCDAAAARHLVARRLKSLRGLEPQSQARRLVALLGRRGFSAALAYQVVREALGAPEFLAPAPVDG